jgi:2-dehydro-3-deoxyphosphogluconate aldolase/(4S)-4-hydroxy-2-oxoglutarate aldolase
MSDERSGVDLVSALRRDRVAAVVRVPQIEDPIGLTETLVSAGVSCVEFTFTTAGALDAIRAASTVPGALVGAGTVLTADQARAAVDAGARFVVSPGLSVDVVEPCRSAGIPFVLGALTPTEVVSAVRAGSAVVKLFPAGLGGPRYLKDLRGPFPDVDFVPSGGVSIDNAAQFLAAGALAVFAGSDLVSADTVARGHFSEVADRARALRVALGLIS